MATIRKKRRLNRQLINDLQGYAFSAPFLILFALFVWVPVIMSLLLSFTSFNVLQPPKFVMFQNYINLFFHDDLFFTALKNTLIFAAITGPAGYILSFFFAWCVNEFTPKVRTMLLLCLYAPSIAGNAYLIWSLIFSSDGRGYANAILKNMGVIFSPIRWFQDEQYMVPLCILVILWMSLGTSLLVFVAGFQGLDTTLYEAGAMDGIKNRWQELWYITLPSMMPQLTFGAVMSITGSFGIGDVLTGLTGNPSYKYLTYTLVHHLGEYGGVRFEMGYASAIASLLFVMMIGTNKLIQKLLAGVGR